MIISLVVKQEKTPLDLLLWRHFRREVDGLLEDTYGRNPGLADLGIDLPVGTVVQVQTPDPAAGRVIAQPVVTLYD